jgi:phenylalanyl-tRNA synthetase beta chain
MGFETLRRLNVGPLSFAPYEGSPYQSGRAAVVSRGDETIGTFGELDPSLRHVFDLPERRVVLGEFDAAALLAGAGLGAYRTLSRYPALTQDLAIVCPEELPAARIEETVRAAAGDLLASLRLFDVYRGEPLPAGMRSLAFTLTFQAPDRTLAEDDVHSACGSYALKRISGSTCAPSARRRISAACSRRRASRGT